MKVSIIVSCYWLLLLSLASLSSLSMMIIIIIVINIALTNKLTKMFPPVFFSYLRRGVKVSLVVIFRWLRYVYIYIYMHLDMSCGKKCICNMYYIYHIYISYVPGDGYFLYINSFTIHRNLLSYWNTAVSLSPDVHFQGLSIAYFLQIP